MLRNEGLRLWWSERASAGSMSSFINAFILPWISSESLSSNWLLGGEMLLCRALCFFGVLSFFFQFQLHPHYSLNCPGGVTVNGHAKQLRLCYFHAFCSPTKNILPTVNPASDKEIWNHLLIIWTQERCRQLKPV